MPRPTPSRVRRTVVALAATVLFATTGVVFSAFRAVTVNPGNSVSTGTVAIGDNDGGSTPLFNAAALGGLRPGQSVAACIRVSYTGTLPSRVRLYRSGASPTNGGDFDLVVERGSAPSAALPSCTGFVSDGGAFSGTISSLPNNYAGGVQTKASDAAWANNENRGFRFTVTARDDTAANSRTAVRTTGSFGVVFEAQNI